MSFLSWITLIQIPISASQSNASRARYCKHTYASTTLPTLISAQTTATLTFAIYMLTQHPHITRRLREEILDKVGNSRPTFEQLKDMKYLRAFINGIPTVEHLEHMQLTNDAETLRLYPPLWVFRDIWSLTLYDLITGQPTDGTYLAWHVQQGT